MISVPVSSNGTFGSMETASGVSAEEDINSLTGRHKKSVTKVGT